jgi:hypothetical protein
MSSYFSTNLIILTFFLKHQLAYDTKNAVKKASDTRRDEDFGLVHGCTDATKVMDDREWPQVYSMVH